MRSVGILNLQLRFEERGLGLGQTSLRDSALAHQDGLQGAVVGKRDSSTDGSVS
jgi:hypothetical protein